MTRLTRGQWKGIALACCAAAILVTVFSTRAIRQVEAQLSATADTLRSARTQLSAAQETALVAALERQAARDSAKVEQQLRDSIYREAVRAKAQVLRWQAVVASLSTPAVVDSMPPLVQARIYKDEVERLTAAGDATALVLEQKNQEIADLQASDLRERARADDADARARASELALTAQLAAARSGIEAGIRASRRPWWKKLGSGLRDVGEKAAVAVPAYLIGRLT